jgi:hypothetical protein
LRRLSSGFAGENLGCIVKENAGEEFCETSPALILFVFKNPFEQFFVFHTARSNCKPYANYFVNTRILELICRNEEKLKATMTDEQKELFEKYTDCVREHQTNTDCLIFQNGFKLGARMMLEVMEE